MYINRTIQDKDNDQIFSFLRLNIDHFTPVTDEEFYFMISLMKFKTYKKNEFLIKKGEICNFMVFVKSGGFRYFDPHNDNDFTLDFNFEGEWSGDYPSFITREPSFYSAQALEDSEVLVLSYENNKLLHEKYFVFERYAKKITEIVLFEALNRLALIKRNSPEDNYLGLLKNRPYIFKRVKIQHIASYLGITPQSLSRIRKRIVI